MVNRHMLLLYICNMSQFAQFFGSEIYLLLEFNTNMNYVANHTLIPPLNGGGPPPPIQNLKLTSQAGLTTIKFIIIICETFDEITNDLIIVAFPAQPILHAAQKLIDFININIMSCMQRSNTQLHFSIQKISLHPRPHYPSFIQNTGYI